MANYQKYTNKMKEIQNKILYFIENDNKIEENYENLFNLICDQKILRNKQEMKEFLYLLSKIAKNHHREPMFIDKIEKILINLKSTIQNYFSSLEIFQIFKGNKRIILFFIEESMITIDKSIFSEMTNQKSIKKRYHQYFQPELQKYQHKKVNGNFPQDFNMKRLRGENDNYICKLIRDDLIDDFIDFVTKNEYPLNSKIIISIYETNSFLIKNRPTLIEYAVFFGSFKIFKYLYSHGIKLTGSLWIYAVHSNKNEFISFLESNKIPPNDKTFEEVFKESIKCHHIKISSYIDVYLLNTKNESMISSTDYDNSRYSYYFHYHNFLFFPKNLDNQQILYYACKYDYFIIVKDIIRTAKIDLSEKRIFEVVI